VAVLGSKPDEDAMRAWTAALLLLPPLAACAATPVADPTRDSPLASYSSPLGRTKLKDCVMAAAARSGVSDAKAVETPQGYRIGFDRDAAAFAIIEGTETEASLRYYRVLRSLDASSPRDTAIGDCAPR
jgi:hypothetical protein